MAEYLLLGVLKNCSEFKHKYNEICHYLVKKNIVTIEQINDLSSQNKAYDSLNLNTFKHTELVSFGSYGVVFKSKHKIDKKYYALKMLSHNKKTLLEVRTLSRLKHPNIIRYFHSWSQYSLPKSIKNDIANDKEIVLHHPIQNYKKYLFIQMEYCTKTLREWLLNRTYPPTERDIIGQILRGINYLHRKGIVHMDIKAENIFLKGCVVKIGDFGLSNKKRKNIKKDIYALGILFFEILYPMKTEMERVMILQNVKNGIFPMNFSLEYKEKIEKIFERINAQ